MIYDLFCLNLLRLFRFACSSEDHQFKDLNTGQ